ncbi:S66 family peptidase [Sporolactobacillus pectinivorans]|uniref:S66 family peptidase n=1 Tax=Sporolactobacillus pectinivorans TaxID=1591408 RepID=UPI000C26A26A|nr:S66 peptidase family protein [Sporolactobacillus pectinivorans]
MLDLIKPAKLKRGDKVATVSLSWGGAGDEALLWRYEQGKKRLNEVFGLEVVEMPHTLMGTDFVYRHPEKRAQDLMQAFADPSIKGTVTHLMCLKAGLSSFYGLSVLNDLAENISMPEYSVEWVNKILFHDETIGEIPTSNEWTGERLEWVIENKDISRKFLRNTGYELLQGKKSVTGKLIGGCLEVLDMIKGTSLFPDISCFNDTILFLETSEECPPLWMVEDSLRSYGMMGIFNRINGLIFGKPLKNKFYEEYKPVIRRIAKEFDREEMPILYNASFGHNEPKCLIPYGARAEINCGRSGFSIIDTGVNPR